MNKKIVFYSHDGRSFGHISIMGTLARRLLQDDNTFAVYGISSSPYSHLFLPKNMDYLKLPSYTSIDTNSGTINQPIIPIEQDIFKNLRKSIIKGFFESFKPDYIIIDGHPLGKYRELEETLSSINVKTGWIVRAPPDYPENADKALSPLMPKIKKHITDILVIGDRNIYDLENNCTSFQELAEKLIYVGYLCPPTDKENKVKQDTIFVQIGGGGGGYSLLENITKAANIVTSKIDIRFDIVTGKFITDSERQKLINLKTDNIHIEDYTNRIIDRMQCSKLFIGSGGYGTLCDIVSTKVNAIVFPRQIDSGEQQIASDQMFNHGYVRKVLNMNTSPEIISEHMLEAINNFDTRSKTPIDVNGIRKISEHILKRVYE